MSKYIDADALKEELQQKVFDNYTDEFWGTMQVIDELPAADVEPVRKWIPCSERLPEDRKWVLICYESGGEDIGRRSHGDWWVGYSMDSKRKSVIAWMPLPEPPEVKE